MTIRAFSLEKYLFECFSHLKIGPFGILLLGCRDSWYFLIIAYYQIHHLQTFSPTIHSAAAIMHCRLSLCSCMEGGSDSEFVSFQVIAFVSSIVQESKIHWILSGL